MKRNMAVVGLVAMLVIVVCAAGCRGGKDGPITPKFSDDAIRTPRPGRPGGPGGTGKAPGGGISVVDVAPLDRDPEPDAKKWTFDDPVDGLIDIYFKFDQSDLTPEARADIETNAERLKAHPNVRALIEGHCDERGTIEYNLALGERRALAVRNYLINLGISADRLATISYGEEVPADPRHNEEAWTKNRRAEFNAASQ